MELNAIRRKRSALRSPVTSDPSRQEIRFCYAGEAFLALAAPLFRWQTSLLFLRVRKRRGRQLVAKCACIIHVACKLASCRLLRRNCCEFETHFLFPHSSQVSSHSPVSFCFHSSPGLQRPCLNTSVFLVCIRLNYTACCVPPVHSCISTARFLPPPIVNLWMPAAVMQFWIIGT